MFLIDHVRNQRMPISHPTASCTAHDHFTADLGQLPVIPLVWELSGQGAVCLGSFSVFGGFLEHLEFFKSGWNCMRIIIIDCMYCLI